MNKRSFYIRCEGEGATAVYQGDGPSQENGLTALMVNPAAGASVLIDAAFTRVERIRAVNAIFNFIPYDSLGEIQPDTLSDFFITINGMSHEASRLCEAAQYAVVDKGASHE